MTLQAPLDNQKALSEILSSRLSRTSKKSSVSRKSLTRRKILPRSIFETASQAGSRPCDESKREEQSLRQMTQNAMQKPTQVNRDPFQDMKDSSAYTLFVSRKNSQDPASTIKSAKKPKPDLEAKFNQQKVQTAALLRFINQIESTVAED